MADKHEFLSVTQLDAMTPNERLAAFDERIVTNLDEFPEAFRTRVIATAERLGREREIAAG